MHDGYLDVSHIIKAKAQHAGAGLPNRTTMLL
jgi:hypothetical protein